MLECCPMFLWPSEWSFKGVPLRNTRHRAVDHGHQGSHLVLISHSIETRYYIKETFDSQPLGGLVLGEDCEDRVGLFLTNLDTSSQSVHAQFGFLWTSHWAVSINDKLERTCYVILHFFIMNYIMSLFFILYYEQSYLGFMTQVHSPHLVLLFCEPLPFPWCRKCIGNNEICEISPK